MAFSYLKDGYLKHYASKSLSDRTIYVDAANGNDITGDGNTTGSAFKTPQRGLDEFDDLNVNTGILKLADGVYNENYRPATDFRRAGTLVCHGKITPVRSARVSSSEIKAGIVIVGNDADPSAVVIETVGEYKYGIYVETGNIGVQSLTVRAGTVNGDGQSLGLLVAHRVNTYVQTSFVKLEGMNTTILGAYTEAGGFLETYETSSRNCITGMSSLAGHVSCAYVTEAGSISDCETGITGTQGSFDLFCLSSGSGYVSCLKNCTTGISLFDNATMQCRGWNDSDGPLVEGVIRLTAGAHFSAVFAQLNNDVSLITSTAKFSQVGFQDAVLLQASDLWLNGSKSYVAPNTTNNQEYPIAKTEGSRIYRDGVNEIIGSTGKTYAQGYVNQLLANGDDVVMPLTQGVDSYFITGGTANRKNCQISSNEVDNGRVIHVMAFSWAVELVDGIHMNLPFGAIKLGGHPGFNTGASFLMNDGKWNCTALGQKLPDVVDVLGNTKGGAPAIAIIEAAYPSATTDLSKIIEIENSSTDSGSFVNTGRNYQAQLQEVWTGAAYERQWVPLS